MADSIEDDNITNDKYTRTITIEQPDGMPSTISYHEYSTLHVTLHKTPDDERVLVRLVTNQDTPKEMKQDEE